jgi:glycosyltransferase involved in cell wall biosynthesis
MIERLKSLRDSLGLKGIKIAMLCGSYPSREKPYSGFFHSLARVYKELFPLSVFVPGESEEYEYDGVKVKRRRPPEIYKEIASFKPDILLVMPVYPPSLLNLASYIRERLSIPRITFPIGIADAFYTPFYYYQLYGKIPKNAIVMEFVRMHHLRRYIKRGDELGDFIVHPSNWQKVACERSTLYKPRNVRIIPFPVDTRIFQFQPRKGRVEKLICVRPHSVRKYGVDLVIKASRGKYKTDIYGEGPLLIRHMALARRLRANVEFFPKFFTTHRDFGEACYRYQMGLMFTRADTQGVTVCEMQATGLPVITSSVWAVPEFATGGTILLKNYEVEKTEQIIDEINEKGILEELSWKAYTGIVEKCGLEKVMKEHLSLFSELLSGKKAFAHTS